MKTRANKHWEETADMRELQLRRHLSSFAQYHYAWLRKIGREWKKRGEYALDRFSLMDHYATNEDIEVAGYVSLLTNNNMRLHDQITELRNLIGRRPWEWVKSRGFITLSKPEVANERIVGTGHTKGDLFNVLDWLWNDKLGKRGIYKPGVNSVLKIQDEQYMLTMLSMRLTKDDGIGKGVLPDYGTDLGCPVNGDMLKLIRTFYPRKGKYGLNVDAGNADDVLMFMGYDDSTDFVYTYQGYCRMRELMPDAIARNERLFQKRYKEWRLMDEHKSHFRSAQMEILPEIRFE